MERVFEALAEHDCRPRGSHLKLRARCPVHGSQGPTLAASQGREGALVYCHAQCELDDILAAIGLTKPDLYDEPREGGRPWSPRPVIRSLTPAQQAGEAVGRVIARAAVILATRDAMRESAVLRPRLTADERVELAEWGCREDARLHYDRTLARWAALATNERYVRQAATTRAEWLAGKGDPPCHEQFMVLMFRAEDVVRGAPDLSAYPLCDPAPVATVQPVTRVTVPAWKRFRGIVGRVLTASPDARVATLRWAAGKAAEMATAGVLDRAAAERALRAAGAEAGLSADSAGAAIAIGFREKVTAGASR